MPRTKAKETGRPAIARRRFDAVLFDLDGVLTRTARVHAAAWKKLFDAHLRARAGADGFRPFDAEKDYRQYVDGKPRYDGVRSFLASRDIELPEGHASDAPDAETVCGLGNEKNRLFREVLRADGVQTYDNAVRLVERLRNKGFKTAVVSSSKNCAIVLDAARIAHLFEVRVDGVDAETLDLAGKPAPALFLEAARRLGVEPERAVVVEDAIAGVEAGKRGAFGLVVGVDRDGRRDELAAAGADVVVQDLGTLEVEVQLAELPSALAALDGIARELLDRDVAVFLDYDGTLSPIVPRPEDALLPPDTRAAIERLARLCPVAIVSGRGLADVRERIAIDALYYAGSHGFEIVGPGGLHEDYAPATEHLPALDDAEKELARALADIDGAQVERKKFSLAVHYRNVAASRAGEVESAVDRALASRPGLRKGTGKKVFELQPDVDWHKGRALVWLLEQLGLDHAGVLPVYIGDDVTDEDAFGVVERRGLGIVVGDEDRATLAECRLRDPGEVRDFIERLAAALEERAAWRLAYEGFEPEEEGLREALCTLGNGYFATRGAAAESRADGVHYPGTYLAGGYNRLTTALAGHTIENEDLVNLPNWLALQFRVAGEEWFALDRVEILAYRQELDMRRGLLRREVRFRDGDKRETRLRETRLVSMARMHLAATETVITPLGWSGAIEIRAGLDGRVINAGVERYRALNGRHLEPVAERDTGRVLVLETRTSQSKVAIAQAARVQAFTDGKAAHEPWAVESEPGHVARNAVIAIAPDSPLRIEKVVALYTGRDTGISECALQAEETAADAPAFAALRRDHAVAWEHLWRRFDVRLDLGADEGDDHDVQRVLRLYAFHLLQTASMHSLDIDVGMPSRGWHGEAYRGHVFWDELIIFPFLNHRAPQITRALLMYRYRRLPAARAAAAALGYRGAMFPWQSGSDGREESQRLHLNPRSGRWIPDHTHLQRHINSAIVYNIWQYYQVTGDMEFLASYGAEMIVEIARFWASIATYDEDLGRYRIRGVVGPDEFHVAYPGADHPGLDDNAYTNLMAVFVLERALELLELLHPPDRRQLCETLGMEPAEQSRWADIARKMRLVFHGDGILSQFDGYDDLEELDWDAYRERYGDIGRLDRILEAEDDSADRYKLSKQADVLMLFNLFSADELAGMFDRLGYPFDGDTIRRNTEYYLGRTSNGSSLSRIIHSWVAARCDRAHSWRLFREALATDVADVQGGTTREGIHLGAMAGCVDLIQRCYTGLETRAGVLYLDPQFPPRLRGIHLHLRYRGHWLEVEIDGRRIEIQSTAGGSETIQVDVKGERFPLEPGGTLAIPLPPPVE